MIIFKNTSSFLTISAIFIFALLICQSSAFPQNTTCNIKRFAEVEPALYRGAQPTSEDYKALKTLGVRTVVSFRKDSTVNKEKVWAEREGIRFISLSWKSRDPYSPIRNQEFLRIARDSHDRPLFVHCKQGRDRTGFMIAMYRIAVDGWSEKEALREMKSLGYSEFMYPTLRHNLHRFAKEYGKEMTYSLLDRVSFALAWIKEIPLQLFHSVIEISPLSD